MSAFFAHPEQMVDFQRYIRFSTRLILNLPGLKQSLSLEITPIDNVELYHPLDNIVCDQSCVECKRSNEPSVCHRLLFIL